MGLTEDRLYEAFGLEQPSSDTGAEDQGVAAPDEKDVQDGGKVSEVADPIEESEGNKRSSEDKTKSEVRKGATQDRETNARFAAQRRAHEKSVDDILSQEKQKREDMLASLSLKLKNGDVVRSEEDLQRYLDEREEASADTSAGVGVSAGDADEGEGSPATVEGAPHPSATQTPGELTSDEVRASRQSESNTDLPPRRGEGDSKGVKEGALGSESSAALRAAIEAANAAKMSFSEQAAALDERETRRAFLDDIASISHYDPAIRTPEDLDRDPKIEEVRRYMAQGNSVKDSWRLAHFDEIMERERNGERVRTQNRGTSHLSSPASATSDDVYLSPEQAKYFRAFDSEMSESDMRSALRKYKK